MLNEEIDNEVNKEELAACPFCGCSKIFCYRWGMSSFWSISCGDDSCPLSSCLENRFESERQARDWWNVRHGRRYDPDYYKSIEKLKE